MVARPTWIVMRTLISTLLAALVASQSGALPAAPTTAPETAAARALRRRGLQAARAGRWEAGAAALEQSLKDGTRQPEALYELGVCRCQLSETATALRALDAALAAGCQDYVALEQDPRLDPLRSTVAFQQLLRSAAARRDAFDAEIEAGVRETYRDTPFRVSRASGSRVILVTDAPAAVAEALGATLASAEAAHRQCLFPNGLRHAIVVQASQGAAGTGPLPALFSPASRTLGVNPAAPPGALLREFARALHFDDQAARGQLHAPWLAAGLAALYEQARMEPTGPRALEDWRITEARQLAATPAFIPLARLVALPPASIDRAAASEARALLFWLQETHRLRLFYEAYLDAHEEDPTGRRALEQVLGPPLEAGQAGWTDWLKPTAGRRSGDVPRMPGQATSLRADDLRPGIPPV